MDCNLRWVWYFGIQDLIGGLECVLWVKKIVGM